MYPYRDMIRREVELLDLRISTSHDVGVLCIQWVHIGVDPVISPQTSNSTITNNTMSEVLNIQLGHVGEDTFELTSKSTIITSTLGVPRNESTLSFSLEVEISCQNRQSSTIIAAVTCDGFELLDLVSVRNSRINVNIE